MSHYGGRTHEEVLGGGSIRRQRERGKCEEEFSLWFQKEGTDEAG